MFTLHTYLSAQCGYQMVWSDEFNSSTLDLNNWSYQIGAGGWGNAELQTYTNTNAVIQNGVLQIIADEPTNGKYTSSRIRSLNNFDIKYGRLEASIRLPQGQGLWPAFWMMPSCSVFGGWPSSGEIDIMEYLGHQNNICYATCHFGNAPNDKGQLGTPYTLPNGNFANGFHLFAIEWGENNIKWFVDGVLIYEVEDTDVITYNWPFNEHFHFILNLAVGGNWPGAPNNQTIFPSMMEIDYVRAYQLVDNIEIVGDKTEAPNTNGSSYSVPLIAGATYDWYIPDCANFISGQGTSQISVDWLTDGGEISVVVGLPCKTIIKTIDVVLSNNKWENAGFENGFKGWLSNFNNGTTGSFDLVNVNPFNENQHVCLTVSSIATNFWDVQYRHNLIPVTAGTAYMLRFYAKADINTRQMRIDFRDTNGNISTDNMTFNLTTNWVLYEHIYTAPYNINNLAVDFNHGFETGIFCYDEVSLEVAGPITGNCPTVDCVTILDLMNNDIQDGLYKAAVEINSESIINSGQTIDFNAGQCILMEQGFEVDMDVTFKAEISPCN